MITSLVGDADACNPQMVGARHANPFASGRIVPLRASDQSPSVHIAP